MLKNRIIKGLLGVSAAAALLGVFTAHAQTVAPPKTGEANDHTSPNAVEHPAPKAKPMKHKVKKAKVKPPVTGEANDHTAPGGTTEAAKAAKAAKAAGM